MAAFNLSAIKATFTHVSIFMAGLGIFQQKAFASAHCQCVLFLIYGFYISYAWFVVAFIVAHESEKNRYEEKKFLKCSKSCELNISVRFFTQRQIDSQGIRYFYQRKIWSSNIWSQLAWNLNNKH